MALYFTIKERISAWSVSRCFDCWLLLICHCRRRRCPHQLIIFFFFHFDSTMVFYFTYSTIKIWTEEALERLQSMWQTLPWRWQQHWRQNLVLFFRGPRPSEKLHQISNDLPTSTICQLRSFFEAPGRVTKSQFPLFQERFDSILCQIAVPTIANRPTDFLPQFLSQTHQMAIFALWQGKGHFHHHFWCWATLLHLQALHQPHPGCLRCRVFFRRWKFVDSSVLVYMVFYAYSDNTVFYACFWAFSVYTVFNTEIRSEPPYEVSTRQFVPSF